MKCPTCKKPIRCTDTRKKLSYVPDLKPGDKEPIRERKYICVKCDRIYITREFIFMDYPPVNDIKDKRIARKRRSHKKK